MNWKPVALSFGALVGCKVAPVDDTADQCLAVCGAELELSIPTDAESFQIQVFGDEFNTLNLACPDGIQAGGPAQVEVECVAGGVMFTATDYLFPDTLTISVDMGEEQVISPAWEMVELCGTSCNQAFVDLAQ